MRLVVALTALVGLAALSLQFTLTISGTIEKGGTVLGGLWDLVMYFTIWSNIICFVVMAGAALSPRSVFNSNAAFLIAVPSVMLAGTVFFTLLTSEIAPWGTPHRLSQNLLHAVVPILAAIAMATRPPPAPAFRQIGWGMLPAAVYGVYILIRGPLTDVFPYWFVNVYKLGVWGSVKSAAMLLSTFAAFTLVAIVLAKLGAAARQAAGHAPAAPR